MKRLLTAVLLALSAMNASAIELGGVSIPEYWDAGGTSLVLNGAGIREYGFFGINVYVAALYLPQRNADAPSIIDSTAIRVIHMTFFRDASLQDTRRAWQLYFEANCLAPCQLPKASMATFMALVPATVAGEAQTFVFENDKVEMYRNGRLLGQVEGAGFSGLLMSTWIGAVPTTPELRDALLGVPK